MAGTPELTHAYTSLDNARPDYDRALAMYDGTVEEYHASAAVRKLFRKSIGLDNFNFARIPVTAVADKLYVNATTAGETVADSVIQEVWDYNELSLEAPILHRNVLVFGDAYVMAWPSVDDAGDLAGIDLINEDPRNVRVFYDAVNPRKKTHAIKTWSEGEASDRITYAFMYYPDRVERWMHKGRVPKTRTGGQNQWKPYTGDGKDAVLENPLGFVPFYHFRTDRPYGEPEHLHAYGPQLTINKLVTSHVAAIDFQIAPQRYSLAESGTAGPQYGNEVDPFSPEDAEHDPESLIHASQLESDPGTIWPFENTKAVGQFDAADAKNFLEPFDRYIKAMAQTTSTPFHEFDSTGDAVSGESRRRTNEAFYSKIEARQASVGATWSQLWMDVLEYLGIAAASVDVVWRPVVSADSKADLETLQLKRALGVPNEVLLIEAGYAKEDVAEWMRLAAANAEPADSLEEPTE